MRVVATTSSGAKARSSVEVSVRSGSVRISVGEVDVPVIVSGTATIDDNGVVAASPSSTIELVCPRGTDVFVATASGSVSCRGPLGSVRLSTKSGRLDVETCSEADLRTSSGRVVVGHVQDRCRVTAGSGSVTVGSASDLEITTRSGSVEAGGVRDGRVHAASGRIIVSCVTPGEVEIRTMSGNVNVSCVGDWAPLTELHARRPKVVVDDLRRETREGVLRVSTLSGSIKVRPA